MLENTVERYVRDSDLQYSSHTLYVVYTMVHLRRPD